ncbi:MAG: hypothetical protein U0350_02450 [Caldilineaceae bacterium]
MTITELLSQINMDTADPNERARRVEMCLHALKHGAEIRGIVDGKVTTIGLGNDGRYLVTQEWTVQP